MQQQSVKERFSDIQSALDVMLAKEEACPTLTKPIMKNIAGFEIVDPDANQKAIKDRVAKIQNYAINKSEMLKRVREAGVEPLATLPTTAWNAICQKSELYQLSPAGGKIRINLSVLDNKIQDYVQILEVCSAVALLFGSAIGTDLALNFYLVSDWHHMTAWQIVGSLVIGLFPGILVALMAGFLFIGGMGDMFSSLYHKWAVKRYLNSESMMKSLLKDNGSGGWEVGVKLPDPPAEIQTILTAINKSYNLSLKVAAVADAITLDKRDLASKLRKNFEMEMERRRQIQADPILYVEGSGVVVIVGQFGDFPIEKDIVKKLSMAEVISA